MNSKYHFPNIIGRSDAIKQVFLLMEQAIDSQADVLITGETGTGKELVARAIHDNSIRKEKRLFVVNCGAVPEEVLVIELFGHCRGAFNGAIEEVGGLFETAEGSTLILDEIDATPLAVQPSLLRVLDERKVIRLGETTERAVDVRVICISNRNLAGLVQEGRFREDLYGQLKRCHIHLPPLRERSEDVPLLAERFYQEACHQAAKALDGFAPDVMEALSRYPWPGNVRELRNAIHRACVLAEAGEPIQIEHLPSRIIQVSLNQ